MIEVNLLPGEHKRASGASRKRRPSLNLSLDGLSLGKDPWTLGLGIAALVIPAVILGLWLTQRSATAELEERLEAATADSARLADLRAVSDSLTARQELIRERVALVEQLDRGRFIWPHIMDEVSRALPELAWLMNVRELSATPEVTFQLQGMAARPLVITEFVRNLEASAYVSEVRIMGSQRQQLEGELAVQAFTLNVRYRRPPGPSSTVPLVPQSEL